MNYTIRVILMSCCIWWTTELLAQDVPIDSTYLLEKLNELEEYKANDDYEAVLEWKLSMEDVLKDYCCKESISYIVTMEWLGSINQEYGYYKASNQVLKEAVLYARKVYGTDNMEYAITIMRLANLYLEMGLLEESEALFLEMKVILAQERYENNRLIGDFYTNLANLYSAMGRDEEAMAYYETAKEFNIKNYGKHSIQLGYNYENIAIMYWEMGNYQAAENYYQEALAIYKKFYGEENLDYAITLNNIGTLYTDMKRYDEAKESLLQSLAVINKYMGKDNVDYIITLRNIGDLYIFMTAYEDAKLVYEEALLLTDQILNRTDPDYLISYACMQNYYLKVGDYKTAEYYLLESMAANAGLSDYKKLDIDAVNKYDFYSYVELIEVAKDLLELWKLKATETKVDTSFLVKAVTFTENILTLHKKQSNSFLVAENQLNQLADNREIAAYGYWFLNALEKIDAKQSEALLDIKWTEYNKTSLLNTATQLNKAQSKGLLPEDWLEEEQELKEDIQAVELAMLEDKSNEDLREKWNQLSLDRSALELKIKETYPKYYSLKYKENVVDAALIQEQLDAQTAILSYFTAGSYLYIFYLSQDRVRAIQQVIPTDSLRIAIKSFRNSLTNYIQLKENPVATYREYTQYGHQIYQWLIAPLEQDLKKDEILQIVIIPDGELGYIPFESLLTQVVEQDQPYTELPYLMRDYELIYNYSATLLYENREEKRRGKNGKLLAIASSYKSRPKSDRSAAMEQLRTILQPLPAAEEEVRALSNSFAGTFLFDSLATERNFKAIASEYDIIHLAMHGLLNQKNPILSSLAFTEDGEATEDNFLQAYEISKLDLNARLVVLSACETGYGKFAQGEGVLSLARSFMYAGVPSLLVSLWQVNDQSTSVVMQNFYRHLAAGKTKSAALRQAKLDYIEQADGLAAHPAFWSPFILIGDESPVKIQRKGVSWLWLATGGLLIIGLGFASIAISRTRRRKRA